MSKYEKLWEFAKRGGRETLKLNYVGIKDVIGFDIDRSFLTHKGESADFGYRVGKISLKDKTVVFNKKEVE